MKKWPTIHDFRSTKCLPASVVIAAAALLTSSCSANGTATGTGGGPSGSGGGAEVGSAGGGRGGSFVAGSGGRSGTQGGQGGSGGRGPIVGNTGGADSQSGTGGAASASGGAGGSSGSGAMGGTSSSAGGTSGSAGSVGSGVACPMAATFCSGFEDSALPTGAIYRVNAAPGDWTRDFAIDPTMHNTGKSALLVKASTDPGTSGSAYKMLSVPTPGPAFWVRFYIWSEIDLGGAKHNPFAAASGSDDPNDAVVVEFAEDVGIAFNSRDDVVRPDGYSRDNPFTLPKATWHCIEISYDSQTRNQRLFINGTQHIDVVNWPAAAAVATPFKTFKFGLNQLNTPPRKLWYDDVAVAPQRVGCF